MRAAHRYATLLAVATLPVVTTGCEQPHEAAAALPVLPAGYSIAVAPALNFSGAGELDPVRVADLLASELGQIDGLTIIPVSRVVAVLARDGRLQIESPRHALQVAQQVGAQAIVVLGVTEYDPYPPMVVALAAQLYSRDGGRAAGLPSAAHPAGVRGEVRVWGGADPAGRPEAQVQVVYNAAHEGVVRRVRKYAESRNADKTPYGWRRYMVSQELFLRFCCADLVGGLMEQARLARESFAYGAAGARESG